MKTIPQTFICKIVVHMTTIIVFIKIHIELVGNLFFCTLSTCFFQFS
jgi:hypothetical protein